MAKNNKQSLSEQSQHRGNIVLLIIGMVLLLLFMLALCQLPSRKKTVTQTNSKPQINVTIGDWDKEEKNDVEKVLWKEGDALLVVNPTSVSVDSVVGKRSVYEISLRAENASIKLQSKKLLSEDENIWSLSGSCMEKGKDILEAEEECTIVLEWQSVTPRQLKNTLQIEWLENNPRVTRVEKTSVPINVQVLDSNPCVICKCDEKSKHPDDVPKMVAPIDGGDPKPVENGEVEIDGVKYPVPPDGPIVDDEGRVIAVVEPKFIPLNLKNELMGTVADNREVLDFDDNVIGRLLGDDTIVNEKLEVLGKAIRSVPVMVENGDVIGKISVDLESKTVRATDDKGTILGYPRTDGQVVDTEGKPLGFLAPWGIVINFNGDVLGGIVRSPDAVTKKNMLVLNNKSQVVGYMRPMGLAVNKKGELVGGVVPSGVVVGGGCRSHGSIAMNGQVFDDYKQHIGHALLDKVVVDIQGNELGSVVRQGLVIDSNGKIVGFINSEGSAINDKGAKIGCVNPDGSVFAKEKFVGAIMPEGRVIREGCGQVGSVYPDGKVMSMDLQHLGKVLPDGTAVGEKKELGWVAPWGTAIAPDCQFLGLVSLNGTVVTTDGSLLGCLTRDKKVQNNKGDMIGMLTPLGILMNEKNQIVGRVSFDGQIINDKGNILGCVNSSKNPLTTLANSTRGVVIDENGHPIGWSFVAGKTYDSDGKWMGDVTFNGWVIGEKNQLKGVVPFSGTVFSDRGEIVGRYDQMSGAMLSRSGQSIGRVLPSMITINNAGTEILGRLIPEETVFVDMQGQVLGTLRADGVLVKEGQEVPAKILANGTMVDEKGKILGARLWVGPVLNTAGKYIGVVTKNGDFVNEQGIVAGRALANGLVVSGQKQVLGKVFPQLSTAVSIEGWLGSLNPQLIEEGENKSYQGQIVDVKGNLIGNIGATGQVIGLDQNIKGSLVPIAPYVTMKGSLLGWGNFQGEVNAPDGRSVATVLPSGLALNSAQMIQGMVVDSVAIVGTMGEYLGHPTSRGQLLSEKGEILAVVGASRFVYDTQGVLLGQLLAPGVVIDADNNLIGWTRYDGQIEDGTKVIGQVGLDGHVFDENGQIIGAYFPLGMVSFSETNKVLGVLNEKGYIQNINGEDIAKAYTNPYAEKGGRLTGRMLPDSPLVINQTDSKVQGVIAPDGNIYDMTSRREKGVLMTNGYSVGSAGLVDGAVLINGSAIGTTLGMLGQVYPNGAVYVAQKHIANTTGTGFVFSLAGELLGGIFSPGVIIDKKGAIVAATGATSAVMSKGKQVGSKMAFDSVLTSSNKWLGNLMPRGAIVNDEAQLIGTISLDASVLDEKDTFIGRVLPDGSVSGVPQKSVYNTMPYIGHTIVQGLPLGYRKEILGRTTVSGDILDKNDRSIGRIRDIGSIFGESQKPLGVVLPYGTAVAKDGRFLGMLSSDGMITSYTGETVGTASTNLLVKGSSSALGDFDVLGTLIPSDLIVNNCKVVGQTAYDGRVITGQGSIVGRLRKDRIAVDAQDQKIGYIAKKGPVTTEKTGKYIGRILPDGTMVDVNGVEVACSDDEGGLTDANGNPYIDIETGEGARVVNLGPVVGPNGELTNNWIDSQGRVRGPDGEILGYVAGEKVVDENGNIIDLRVLSQTEELIFDPNDPNRIRGTFDVKGIVRDPKGNFVMQITDDNRIVNGEGIEFQYNPKQSGGIGKKFYFQDCTLFDFSNSKVASLMANGQLLDENGKLFGFMNPDGEIKALNGALVDKVSGYNLNMQECGLNSEKANSERKICMGRKCYVLGNDGFLTDPNTNEVIGGWDPELKRIFDFNGDPIDPTTGKKPVEKPKVIKIDEGQREEIQQKLSEKRQKMRQGLGGAPLTMSAEMQARYKPKKDKNWDSLGVSRSVSSWSVDMSRVILQGRSIPAVLARSIDSRFSDSPALAIVDTNIYAEEGRNILIPAGSQLIGSYSGEGAVQDGVAKINISWNRLIRPDGVAFDLSGSPSADAMGRGGIAAFLDEQLVSKYSTALSGTLAQSAVAYLLATNEDSNMSDSGNSSQSNKSQAANDSRKAFIDTFGQIVDDWVAHGQAVPAIVYVPIGTRLNVVLNQDLWLRSDDDDEESANAEYGAPTTQAQKPDMPSWEEKRRQQMDNNIPNSPNSRQTSQSNSRNNNVQNTSKAKQEQAKKDAENLQTPIYNGEDPMPDADLENRVVESSSSTPNLF